VAGHGVASGRATTSPYPAGTIHLQAPFFAARGIDLAPFFAGTLNLEAPRGHWRLSDPDAHLEAMEWTDRHPPETFSFWHCHLRVAAEPAATAAGEGEGTAPGVVDPPGQAALIYYPHPETKRAHHQAPSCLEVLAPWIPGLHPGIELELGVDPRRCRLIDPVRLRARLLEFLKFRVLAAQEEFFVAFLASQPSDALGQDPRSGVAPSAHAAVAAAGQAAAEGDAVGGRRSAPSVQPNAHAGLGPTGDLDPKPLRAWLCSLWPEALDLDDTDLLATLEQARRLYLN
jgi:hypothetical protein